ncbi:MAG: hypothetical protein ACREIC_16595 [Limisphaerales bacterium]
MSITIIPWFIAAFGAICFAWMARHFGRNLLPWALSGGFAALIVTTIIWGVGRAADIPFSDHDRLVFHLRWTLEALATVVAVLVLLILRLRAQAENGSTSTPSP